MQLSTLLLLIATPSIVFSAFFRIPSVPSVKPISPARNNLDNSFGSLPNPSTDSGDNILRFPPTSDISGSRKGDGTTTPKKEQSDSGDPGIPDPSGFFGNDAEKQKEVEDNEEETETTRTNSTASSTEGASSSTTPTQVFEYMSRASKGYGGSGRVLLFALTVAVIGVAGLFL